MTLSISETRSSLMHGEMSVAKHVEAVLTDIRHTGVELGAFVSVADDEALSAAEAADTRVARLGPSAWQDQPLLGITVAVKDLIQTEDLPTTRGSLLPNRRVRADAPAVARLRAAGAIVVGKTTTSEYGWSASTVSRLAAPTRNPWAPDRSAGGSSGGSAAAVAAGLCSVALGTDGAGSIRIPAAFCGVVGYKPSFGQVPYVPPCADRMAHLGPLTVTVADAAEVAAVIFGPDPYDPDSGIGTADAPRLTASPRVGWLEFPGTTPEVREVSERVLPVLAGLDHQLQLVDVPFADPYPALVDLIAATEAAGTAPGDEDLADPGRLAVARYGRTISGAAVMRAEEQRMSLRTTLRLAMERHDLLAMATVPVEPFDVNAIGPAWATRPEDLAWLAWAPACYPFNLTGQPALSLPVGTTSSGLPVGVQFVGPVGADLLVLDVARQVEAALSQQSAPPIRTTERTG